jgi:hypothetical protein
MAPSRVVKDKHHFRIIKSALYESLRRYKGGLRKVRDGVRFVWSERLVYAKMKAWLKARQFPQGMK